MKCLVFDSGPIITFALNGMLDKIPKLKQKYKGNFFISNAVKEEIIELPSKSKKYSFESLNIKNLIVNHYIEVYDTKQFSEETEIITNLVNSIFLINGVNLKILNKGEIETLILAKNINAEAIVVDERTTRLLLENPYRLRKFLEKKFNTKVEINKENLGEFESHFSTIKIIRSVELALVCIDLGLFNDILKFEKKEVLVMSLLWAMKCSGCAISEMEIKKLTKIYRKGK